MELLDRYLYAVKEHLPKAQQADIVAELSDEIQSVIEEKEAGLGRPLGLDEQSAVIENYGPPVLAAARYLKHQYLIGPAFFPFYLTTLKFVLSIAIGLMLLAAAFRAIAGGSVGPFFISWSNSWESIFWIIGIVTVIFAIRERVDAARPAQQWDPRRLPVPQSAAPVSRFSSGIDVFFNVLFLSWVMDLPGVRSAFWHVASGGVPSAFASFSLAPIWQTILYAFSAIAVARILQGCINLIRPDLTRLRAATLFFVDVVSLVVFCVALQTHTFVLVTGPTQDSAASIVTAQALNVLVWWFFAGGIAVAALCAILNLRTLLQRASLA